jgi:predicted GH43/DUF377 family glycosyl hydrolase
MFSMPHVIARFALMMILVTTSLADEPAAEVAKWLGRQEWQRDAKEPVLNLGQPGEFDDTHLFAPTVIREDGKYLMWYCGSQGFAHDLAPTRTKDERTFRVGLATSQDGVHFQRHAGPVMALSTPRLSIVTPTVLREANGQPIREDGKLRMWFTSATFGGGGQPHAIQQAVSIDGIEWTDVSPIQIPKAYAPAVVKTPDGYKLWYTEPGRYPWLIRHAVSPDGQAWTVTEKPVLVISQAWEHDLQIYPCVLLVDGVYLMWYSSYLQKNHETTAIGFAASLDGVTWYKHPENPVLRPDPSRAWESHYVSSHSVMRLKDGRFRIWYASRKSPPFQNLYFALNTAVWSGPEPSVDR